MAFGYVCQNGCSRSENLRRICDYSDADFVDPTELGSAVVGRCLVKNEDGTLGGIVTFSIELLKKKLSLAPHIKTFAEGETLFHQGQGGSTLFIILKGQVQLLLDSETGEHVFAIASAGDLLGERALLGESPHPRAFSAQAVDSVIAIELSSQNLIQLQVSDPDFILDILKRTFEVSAKRLELANYLARALRGSDLNKRFYKSVLYIAHSAGVRVDQGILITKLKEALDYLLELDPQQRNALIEKLIKAQILKIVDGDSYCLLDEKKLVNYED